MTGYDIYKRALSELCIEKSAEDTEKSIPPSAVNIINDIGSDLISGFHCNTVYDEIDVKPETVPAFTYGVAMLIAALLGNQSKNAFFTELYNAKRATVKSENCRVKNAMPGN